MHSRFVGLLTLAVLFAFPTRSLAFQLGARLDLPTNGSPVGAVLGDVNADGRVDAVFAITGPPALAVFLGDGLGNFGARLDLALRGAPTAVRIADVTGDGRADLIAACSPSWVCVVPGAPSGWNARVDLAVASGPVALDVGDLNADGRRDIVVACLLADCVSVLPATAAGGFGTRVNPATSSTPMGVAIASVTGDARPDLLVTSATTGVMAVLENTGANHFEFWQDFSVGADPRGVAAGDFNGDGRADAAVANAGGASVSVLLADATAGFVNASTLPAGAGSSAVVAADVDGDGRLDLVTANRLANTVTVRTGDGTGGFPTVLDVVTGAAPVQVAVARVDADTLADVAVAAPGGNAGIVLRWGLASSTTLSSTSSTGYVGDTPTLIADVSPPTATGQVRFHEGLAVLGTAPLAGGQARLRIATLVLGNHTLTATYGGDAVLGGSTSGPFVQTIVRRPTVTSLGTTPNPARIGETVWMTAQVTPALPGFVEFRDGTTSLGQANLVSGAAVLGVPFATAGTHALTAVFAGSGLYSGSTSSTVLQSVTRLDGTTLTAAPNPGVFGAPVTLTAIVNPEGATGTVTFRDFSSTLDVRPLSGGSASTTISTLSIGYHELTASYSGDGTHPASTSAMVPFTVSGWRSTTELQLPQPTAESDAPVWFLARVTPVEAGTGPPVGSIRFRVDGADFGPLVAVPATGGWVSSDTTTSLAVGTHTVLAQFVGTSPWENSTSPAAGVSIVQRTAPRIRRVRDVPNDQGRWVRLTVAPSPLDAAGAPTPVVRYEVFRRIDDGGALARVAPDAVALAGWDAVGSMGAYTDTLYSIVVPTLADSNVAGLRWSVFRVRAATAIPGLYFDSEPDSGWSKDDLAPPAPGALAASRVANGVRVHWAPSVAPDLAHYRVYRGDRSGFPADSAHAVATAADTTWLDAGALDAWYRVLAVDANGNASAATPAAASAGALSVGTGAPLALAVPTPNPGRGDALSVRFALPSPAPARLELFDVGGRRRIARDVGSSGAGWHTRTLAPGERLAPGLYHLRLTQGTATRMVRWVVVE